MLENLFKTIFGIVGGEEKTNSKTKNRVMRRRLGFEVLEGRELLSAGGLDDYSLYGNNSYDLYETSNTYYESGYSSNYSTTSTSTTSNGVTIPDPLYSQSQGGDLSSSNLDNISSQVTFRAVFTADSVSGWKYLIAHDVENRREHKEHRGEF